MLAPTYNDELSSASDDMAWTEPAYSREEVDAAGGVLVSRRPSAADLGQALDIINNWRSSHAFPVNTFQVGLRGRVKDLHHTGIIAQRIKRLSSIELKLKRFKWLRLSAMQDIGGCRAVVASVQSVNDLVKSYEKSHIKHTLDDRDDYISEPKKSGYRGVHLIYRYASDRSEIFNDLKIEIQIRSQLQHAWATAVETVGTFIQQALKSSRGEREWLRFFTLMGTAIAIREKTQPVPGTPIDKKELVGELREHAAALAVETRLRAYGAALQTVEQRPQHAHYYLLTLEPAINRVTVLGFKRTEVAEAAARYLATEREIVGNPGSEAVLVSVESLAALRRAYPNYFLDTSIFLDAVNRAIA
ncbi:MAG TPA: RelA/SpoT domain-containing protein [Thermoanaerobaculia bacterium]|nr:RelA/SpoT domain-containing protein [Thermoanaerobaculia bacterium]